MTDFAYPDAVQTTVPPPRSIAPPPRYNFGTGHNAPELIPAELLAAGVSEAIRTRGSDLAYYFMGGTAYGDDSLRATVAAHLAADRGVAGAAFDDILITSGSAQGLDLVNQLLVGPGDTIICEQFTYSGALGKIARHGANHVGVALDGDGIVPDALDALVTDLKNRGAAPRYLYAMPTVQNPTGAVMSLERRHALLAVTRRHALPILEDECYADVVWTRGQPPALFALDPAQVIHIGSFSKNLAPALRVGYVAACRDILARMAALKSDGGTGAIDQIAVADFFGRHFTDHLATVAATLEAKADAMVAAVRKALPTAQVCKPRGGIFIWVKLPDNVDTRDYAAAASAAGVGFNPGAEWASDPEQGKSYLRLCFATPSLAEIAEGVALLGDVFARRSDLAGIEA